MVWAWVWDSTYIKELRKADMKKFIIPILILFISFTLALLYQSAIAGVEDSRRQGKTIDQATAISKERLNSLQEGESIRFTVYTHADTVYRNRLTGKYLDEATAENYTIEDIDKMRRLRNVEYIYEEHFNGNGFALTNDYILIKGIKYGELYLKAYLRHDPTIDRRTKFWYNGEVLTSLRTMHTFDAYTGKGISTEKSLTPLLVEEEVRERR